MYIRDIAEETTNQQVCEVMSNFGEIESSSVKGVPAVGKTMKFAIVNFKDKDAAR